MQLSRRAFFVAGRTGRTPAIRPPWAIEESRFIDACSRCDACIQACPTGLLQRGDGGFPVADFTPGRAPDGCTFCGDCLPACQTGALQRHMTHAPWTLLASIGGDCLAEHNIICRTCGEGCEAGAIRFPLVSGGVARPQVDAAQCTGCGACLADCPTRAIRIISAPSHFSALRGAA